MISNSRQKLIVALSLSLLAAREPCAAASPIDFQDGRLSARIENRPLIEVLRELAAATGARFALSDPGSTVFHPGYNGWSEAQPGILTHQCAGSSAIGYKKVL